MNRPAAATMLTIVAVIAGIIAVIDAMRYISLMFSPLNFFGSPFLGAILAGIVAIIWFSVAAQLWNLDPRGWMFVVVIAIVYLIFDVMAIIGGTPIEAMWLSITVSVIALIMALLPKTRASFGQQ